MVILITGVSSGIGNEAARMLAAQRHKVYAAARRTEGTVYADAARNEGEFMRTPSCPAGFGTLWRAS